jgi:group I intron endonuclease
MAIKKYKYISGIYKIINLKNNKIYIGSAKHLMSRKCTHFHNLKYNKHHNIHLQNSYNKYGKDNFIFEVLERCSEKELIFKEQYYIDTLLPDYNICKIAGNVSGRKHSLETIEKIRKANTGYKASDDTRKKQSLSKIGLYKNKSSNVILQLDLNNNVIKKWYNGSGYIAEQLKEFGIKRSGISMCLVCKLNTYKKYKWRYEN